MRLNPTMQSAARTSALSSTLLPIALLASFVGLFAASPSRAEDGAYPKMIMEDNPLVYWRFSETDPPVAKAVGSGVLKSPELKTPPVEEDPAADTAAASEGNATQAGSGEESASDDSQTAPNAESNIRAAEVAATSLTGRIVGHVSMDVAGPRQPAYPLFGKRNSAADLSKRGGYFVVEDPGVDSPLDFTHGDDITIEAWVNPREIGRAQTRYIIGKGRTNRAGQARDNQNYALRLHNTGGDGVTARLSFLFRGLRNLPADAPNAGDDWHRWISHAGFTVDSGWHHVAVTYRFGDGDSLRGYIDGVPVTGAWDMGGKSNDPPVTDDDQLWIGSALGGNPRGTFNGVLDEVALYRAALSAERIRSRVQTRWDQASLDTDQLPGDTVRVEIFEGVPDRPSWDFPRLAPTETYDVPAFTIVEIPPKYSAQGVRVDRSNPFVVQSAARVTLPQGRYRVLLRAIGGARLTLDDALIVSTDFPSRRTDGHDPVPDYDVGLDDRARMLRPGDAQRLVEVDLAAGTHRFVLEAFAGGKSRRAEVGELTVALAREDEPFRVLSPTLDLPLTDEAWHDYAQQRRQFWLEENASRRANASLEARRYWDHRHQLTRQRAADWPAAEMPPVSDTSAVLNDVDRFIQHRLETAEIAPGALCDDSQFLRRVYLDTVGVIPTPEEIAAFEHDPAEVRRTRAIERLLKDDRWADHWVSYWQDVLAENPNIVNPTLNNTGPFRWWIYEAFFDNMPLDRFVTALVTMHGSRYGGGPGGFELATENDVPMAAKAHILARAFQGVELKCARCHDAPHHPWTQRDLFSLAAMLKGSPQVVPATSTLPESDDATHQRAVQVTLHRGDRVEAQWPFDTLFAGELPNALIRDDDDLSQQLAARLTWVSNRRFSRVIANRLWKRFLGQGLVEPVDDWYEATPSHPQLLDHLAREFVTHDYDLKHLTRLILNSHAYQRAVTPHGSRETGPQQRLFAGGFQRRLTAEQVVDSLFVTVGKPMRTEELNIDVDASRPATLSLNLGVPRRAWQFTSLSNERDRPSLALPKAQNVIDVLTAFGWRSSRQDPLTDRDETPNAFQPASLLNGQMTNHLVRMTDESQMTAECLRNQGVEQLVETLYQRVLTRRPDASEIDLFSQLLRPGYEERIVSLEPAPRTRINRMAVSWSNHMTSEANRIKLEMERAAQRGDPPTQRLNADWRARVEDMVWALINSPEYVFVP